MKFDDSLQDFEELENFGQDKNEDSFRVLKLYWESPIKLIKNRVALVGVLSSTRNISNKFCCIMRSVPFDESSATTTPRNSSLDMQRSNNTSMDVPRSPRNVSNSDSMDVGKSPRGKQQDYVKIEVECSGFSIEPMGGGEDVGKHWTQVTYLCQFSSNSTVADLFKKKVAKSRFQTLANLKNYLEKQNLITRK